MGHHFIWIVAFTIWISGISPQNTKVMKNRIPAVAGTFYPKSATDLKNEVSNFFSKFTCTASADIAALIVPHAGYVFSGEVAAASYAKLNRNAQYKTIFLIGASHRKHFNGVSTYPIGNYLTPLGEVKINEPVMTQLMDKKPFIYYDADADQTEHSLEVQLPFLQYWLKNKFQIVPLILGSDDPVLGEKLAEALRPWFNPDNLFVISTDFSHYPAYETANKIDAETADAIVSNNSEKLRSICSKNRQPSTNVLTGLCGAAAVQTLLHLTKDNKEVTFEKIMYRNSGDVSFGDKKRVVGYWAIAVNRKVETFSITKEEEKKLLKLSRSSIYSHLKGITKTQETDHPGILNEKCGVFVTLKKEGKLRGCIGRFNPQEPLYQTIQEMAIAAATKDSRFKPVSLDELDKIDVEISVLTPLKKIGSIDEFELGKHGIYIKKGYNSGTFLPQVATETGWSKEELLGHCSRDKAGIGWDGWKQADLYTYEAIIFEEKE
jgi:AmmeMemoRadiSam system protein B/AmmeMemoRadiSam system protein A